MTRAAGVITIEPIPTTMGRTVFEVQRDGKHVRTFDPADWFDAESAAQDFAMLLEAEQEEQV